MPLFQPGQKAAVALLGIERIGTEYEQHGFFRIGLLPRVVLQDVTLDLRSTEGVTAMVERLQRLLSPDRPTRAPFELRGFAIRKGTNAAPLVEASFVRGGRNGIRFSNVTLRRADGNTLMLREARLTKGGDSQFWLEAPPLRLPLLEPPRAADATSTFTPAQVTSETS